MLLSMSKINLDRRSSISSPISTTLIHSITWQRLLGVTIPAPKPRNKGSLSWCELVNPIAKGSQRSRSSVNTSLNHRRTNCTTVIMKSKPCSDSSFTNKNRKIRRSRRSKPTRNAGGFMPNTASALANLTSIFTIHAPKFSKKNTARMTKVLLQGKETDRWRARRR